MTRERGRIMMSSVRLFEFASRVDRVGVAVTRAGLIIVLLWIGGLKVVKYISP